MVKNTKAPKPPLDWTYVMMMFLVGLGVFIVLGLVVGIIGRLIF